MLYLCTMNFAISCFRGVWFFSLTCNCTDIYMHHFTFFLTNQFLGAAKAPAGQDGQRLLPGMIHEPENARPVTKPPIFGMQEARG